MSDLTVLSSEEARLFDTIRKEPGKVLMCYARPLGISPKLALTAVENLIARGDVKRHSHTEQLTLVTVKTMPLANNSPQPEVPSLTAVRYPAPMAPNANDLQAQILRLLDTGDKSTRELAETLGRPAPGLGSCLATLRGRGLVSSSGPLGKKVWHLCCAATVVPVAVEATSPLSKTELMRQELRKGGSFLVSHLAEVAGVAPKQVYSLLITDVIKGVVEAVRDGNHRIVYRMREPKAAPADEVTEQPDELMTLQTKLHAVTAERDHLDARFTALSAEFNAFKSTVRATLERAVEECR